MTKKLVVAKDGYDAETETNPDNLKFSSEYDTLKYHMSGEIDVSCPGDDTYEAQIAHNLGYIPFFIAYVNLIPSSGYSLCPGFIAGGSSFLHVGAYADSTKIYFQAKRDNGGFTSYNFKYKIFRNRTGF